MTATAIAGRVPTRLRRPSGLVRQTRWLFWLCAVASLVLTLPLVIAATDTLSRLLGLGGALLLLLSWTRRYLVGTASLARDRPRPGAGYPCGAGRRFPPTCHDLSRKALTGWNGRDVARAEDGIKIFFLL